MPEHPEPITARSPSARAAHLLRPVIGPEALLVAGAILLATWDRLDPWLGSWARFYPYAVLATGVALAWRLGRSRLLFALTILALAATALVHAESAGSTTRERITFQLTAVLLPLNLAATALLAERGVFTPSGWRHWGALLAQVVLVGLLHDYGGPGTARLLRLGLVPSRWLAWTPLAQPALAAFALGTAALGAGRLLAPDRTGRGYLWTLLAAFLACSASGAARTVYFATAGLILIVGLVETSHFLAHHDSLTGLPARRALGEALERLDGRYVVAMVDVDHFKRLNDTFGHDTGDQVLRLVAARLREIAEGGSAYRYGGEEFAVLFRGRSLAESLPALEALRRAVAASTFTVRAPIRRSSRTGKRGRKRRTEVAVTVSIGVAEPDERSARPGDVLHAADQALYRAKEGGRDRIES